MKVKILFQDDGKSYVAMTDSQLIAKRLFSEKVQSGYYTTTIQHCLCEHGVGEDHILSLKDRYGFSQKIVLCNHCSLIFLANPLDASSTVKFYEDDYRKIYNNDNDNQEAIFQKQYERGVKIFNLCQKYFAHQSDNLNILDIGCNAGGYLKIFQEKGHLVMGIDLDDQNFEFGRKKGIVNLQKMELAKISAESQNQFDVIIMSHVLEHVRDPIWYLKEIHSLLKDEGIFYVEVPNMDFCVKNDILAELQNAHIWYFDEFTLSNILKSLGFEILLVRKPFHIEFVTRKGNVKANEVLYQKSYPDVVQAKGRAINHIFYQNLILDLYRSMRRNLGRVKRQMKTLKFWTHNI